MFEKGGKQMYSVLMAEGADGFKLTSDMFSGLTSTISENAAILVPVGIGLFAVLFSIGLVPKIIKKFAK